MFTTVSTLAMRGLATVLLLAPLQVTAQSYPSKPITLVAPYGVGGNADLAARALSLAATDRLKQPIVVVNRAGAGGLIGSQYVLNAPKDGYTLLVARVGSQAIAPALDPATPYKWDDFTFIGMLEVEPAVCYVKAQSPYRTFTDLLAAAKAAPGKLSYGVSGIDGSAVFPVLAFLNLGLSAEAALRVPYKGGGEVAMAVLGGQVDFACGSIAGSLPSIRSGLLRALVVSTPQRSPDLPDVPSGAELGMANIEIVSGWSALYGPPDLPKPIVDQWVATLASVKQDPAWISQVKDRGSVPSIWSPEETRKFVEAQYLSYKRLAPHFEAK